MPLPRTVATFFPPVMEARRWLDGVTFAPDQPLINVSQAAPVDPPPQALRDAMAQTLLHNDESHLYGPVLGLPALCSALAAQVSQIYGPSADVRAEQTAITSGCNQAFCAAIAALCGEGDEVILPTPWYFNHKMWLDMAGVNTRPLSVETDMLPDPDRAAAMINDRTRAIVLVTPNNPGGAEYPTDLVQSFFDLARRHKIALILDETYRDFHSQAGAPHKLFQDPDWHDTLIHLYSFSKAYRLTGHRVGAMIASTQRLAEAEKFLDTIAICPAQIGQYAALWGIENLQKWLAGERQEILSRRAAITEEFPRLKTKGWKLLGLGGYFAYLEHPYSDPSDAVARQLVKSAAVLTLPGTMFTPEGDNIGKKQLRIAFANVDRAGVKTLFDRLAKASPD